MDEQSEGISAMIWSQASHVSGGTESICLMRAEFMLEKRNKNENVRQIDNKNQAEKYRILTVTHTVILGFEQEHGT